MGGIHKLGAEHGSHGLKGPAPKGLKNLAQGSPWVLGLSPEALKHSTRCRLLMPGGRPLTRLEEPRPEVAAAPSGLLTLERVSQGKPWAKLSWPVGPQTRPYPHPSFREMSKLQRHFEPDYDRAVPPGHFATGFC